MIPNVVGVRLPRSVFDDAAEDVEAEIRIDLLRARIEIERHAEHVANDRRRFRRVGQPDRRRRHPAPRKILRVVARVGVPAPGVDERLFDGDLVEPRVRRGVGGRSHGEQRKDLVVEPELAGVDQCQNRDGRDRFRDAGDAEERIGRDGRLLIHVRKAVAAVDDQPAVPGDGQLAAGQAPFRHGRRHHRVEAGQAGHRLPGDEEVRAGRRRGGADRGGHLRGDMTGVRQGGGERRRKRGGGEKRAARGQ